MPASDIRSRKLQVFIGSDLQDWSLAYRQFSVNYSSLLDQGTRGLIKVEGDLTLVSVNPPESMSPRRNPIRWRPGQPVYIQARNDADTAWVDAWFSRLILTKEPAEPTVNGVLTLSLGCKLRWADSFQLDDDQSGVDFGVGQNCSAIATRLIQASDIAAGSISLNPWPYTIDYPFGKDTGSFAGQAGELAWCNDGRFLYQNVAGTITDKQLSFTPTTAIASMTIGVNGVAWDPSPDPQQPPETTKVAGIGRGLSTLANPDSSTVETEGDFSDYVPTATGFGVIRRTIKTESFNPGNPNTVPPTPPTKTARVQVAELPAMIFQDASDVSPSLVVTDFTDITEVKRYEPGFASPIGKAKLLSITTTKEQRGKSLLDSDLLGNMRGVEVTEVARAHNVAGEFVERLQTVNRQAEILLDETTDDPWNLQEIGNEIVTWEEATPGLFSREKTNAEAVIVSRSNIDKAKQNIWAPQVTTELISPSPRNKPPAVEFYDGGTNAAEIHYEGTASYIHRGGSTGRNRERLYTLSFGFSNAQMTTMATLHRNLLIGRHLSDLIELPINDALLATPPLPEIHVVEGADTYKYLGDALAIEFTPNQTTASCTGIWMSGGYQETVGIIETGAAGQDTIVLELSAFVFSETTAAGQDSITLSEVESVSIAETTAAGQDAIALTEVIPITLSETGAAGQDSITITETIAVTVLESGAAGTDAFTFVDLGSYANFDDVALQLHFNEPDGATTFIDSSNAGRTPSGVGSGAEITEANKQFGSGSCSFNGSGSYLEYAGSADLEAIADLTWEAWVYPTTFAADGSNNRALATFGNSFTPATPGLLIDVSGALLVFDGTNFTITTSTAMTLNAWNHIVFTRESGVYAIYIDGVRQAQTWTNNTTFDPSIFRIGASINRVGPFIGQIDDFRYDPVNAIYTGASFTLPTAQHPDS